MIVMPEVFSRASIFRLNWIPACAGTTDFSATLMQAGHVWAQLSLHPREIEIVLYSVSEQSRGRYKTIGSMWQPVQFKRRLWKKQFPFSGVINQFARYSHKITDYGPDSVSSGLNWQKLHLKGHQKNLRNLPCGRQKYCMADLELI
jgi:hypothetical protein